MSDPVFGRLLTAMVTPMTDDFAVDLDRAGELAQRLVDEQANDGLVVNGTTGESPTTTDEEKADIVRTTRQAVGDRAQIIAGVGSNITAHSVRMAQQAQQAGADGLLVVTPYYSKPTQEGIRQHFMAVAQATDLPIMVYDIPGRTGTAIATQTLVRLADHPQIVAVKDAKGQLVESAKVMADTTLAYYSGDDAITPALLSLGGVGLVGTSTHFTGRRMQQIFQARLAGRLDEALAIYREILPLLTGVFDLPGLTMVKAGLAHQGFDVGPTRLPMVPATGEPVERFCELLDRIDL